MLPNHSPPAAQGEPQITRPPFEKSFPVTQPIRQGCVFFLPGYFQVRIFATLALGVSTFFCWLSVILAARSSASNCSITTWHRMSGA